MQLHIYYHVILHSEIRSLNQLLYSKAKPKTCQGNDLTERLVKFYYSVIEEEKLKHNFGNCLNLLEKLIKLQTRLVNTSKREKLDKLFNNANLDSEVSLFTILEQMVQLDMHDKANSEIAVRLVESKNVYSSVFVKKNEIDHFLLKIYSSLNDSDNLLGTYMSLDSSFNKFKISHDIRDSLYAIDPSIKKQFEKTLEEIDSEIEEELEF